MSIMLEKDCDRECGYIFYARWSGQVDPIHCLSGNGIWDFLQISVFGCCSSLQGGYL